MKTRKRNLIYVLAIFIVWRMLTAASSHDPVHNWVDIGGGVAYMDTASLMRPVPNQVQFDLKWVDPDQAERRWITGTFIFDCSGYRWRLVEMQNWTKVQSEDTEGALLWRMVCENP